MLEILMWEDEISDAQEHFEKVMSEFVDKELDVILGFQGDSMKCRVYWSDKLGIWFTFYEVSNRYWNAFGVGEPKVNGQNITCEINIPYNGINRRIAGAFAKEKSTGDIFLIHRGKVGGGRQGVGKTNFLKQYSGTMEKVIDGESIIEVILIGNLSQDSFADKLSQFVQQVGTFKGQI